MICNGYYWKNRSNNTILSSKTLRSGDSSLTTLLCMLLGVYNIGGDPKEIPSIPAHFLSFDYWQNTLNTSLRDVDTIPTDIITATNIMYDIAARIGAYLQNPIQLIESIPAEEIPAYILGITGLLNLALNAMTEWMVPLGEMLHNVDYSPVFEMAITRWHAAYDEFQAGTMLLINRFDSWEFWANPNTNIALPESDNATTAQPLVSDRSAAIIAGTIAVAAIAFFVQTFFSG
jgi:hypothetical protein